MRNLGYYYLYVSKNNAIKNYYKSTYLHFTASKIDLKEAYCYLELYDKNVYYSRLLFKIGSWVILINYNNTYIARYNYKCDLGRIKPEKLRLYQIYLILQKKI